MKRKSIFIICLLLIACLAFSACGKKNGDGNINGDGGDKETWPSISYLTEAEKYTGEGEITHTTSFADDSRGVYIKNVSEAEVSTYRTKLEGAGWTLEVGPVNNADNTAWGYTKGEATCTIRLYSTEQTEERSSGNFSYNLYIGFEKDGVIVSPGENALSAPTVSINSSGLASWSAVTNANGYKYKINGGQEQATQSTSIQLSNGQSIQVKAVGDGTNHTDSAYSASKTYTAGGGGSTTVVALSDFDYQLGNHYYISSRWDVTSYDNDDNEYVYQEYRRVALISGVYFIEKYDFNYEKSNVQGNYRQTFYIPEGSEYNEYYRNSVNEEFEFGESKTSIEFTYALSIILSETGVTRAKTLVTADTLSNVTAGATSTHSNTDRTVRKYTYGTASTTIYDFYVDTQTKACIKFDDYVNDGHINLSIFSTSGNAWGSNELPARPDGATPEPTALSVPVVTINNTGLASWSEIANASGYKIKINDGAEDFAVGLSEQLSNGDTIQVKAVGDGETYSDSAYSTIQTYTAQSVDPQPTALATPIVSISETGLATWVVDTNAMGYLVKINGGTDEFASGSSKQLSDGNTIQVKAIGDGETYSDSAYSTIQTYTAQSVDPQPTALATPIVSINETGLATWAEVTNASGYKYKINNGTEQTAPASRQVQLTNGQSIVVKAVGNGTTYLDSAYSSSETYTEVETTNTWPTSAKLTEYGFSGVTQPTGSTISYVVETEETENEPAILYIMISNGTGEMFDNMTTSLFALGATNGFNEESGSAFAVETKADLIGALSNGSTFWGLKSTDTEGIYAAVSIEYYASEGLNDEGNIMAAQTFIIAFAEIDLSSSSSNTSNLADYITLPEKFTITYSNADGETRTIVKDGDKLWYHIYSEYEDRESLAIKQSDGTYNTYEKDNKISTGRWGTDPMTDTITYSDDAISALGGFESYLISYAQCKVNGDVFETGAGTTVANMTCNVYTKESYGYTDTYYTYNGLTFKYVEVYEQDEPTNHFTVLTYSATGDLSGAGYSID